MILLLLVLFLWPLSVMSVVIVACNTTTGHQSLFAKKLRIMTIDPSKDGVYI